MIAVTSLFVVVVVGLLISRIAAVALTATGLPVDAARFQARSALTGVGFTTTESETIVAHPLRRRIVMLLMLVGNAGFVTIVASVALSFATSGDTGDALIRMGITIGGLAVIMVVARSRVFERRLNSVIRRLLDRFSDLDVRDMHTLMQLSRDYAVSEIEVTAGDWVADKALADLELPDEGVLVLALERADAEFIGAPRGGTVVHPGDTLFLYGRATVLSDLGERPASFGGEIAHREAVREQQEILTDQQDEE